MDSPEERCAIPLTVGIPSYTHRSRTINRRNTSPNYIPNYSDGCSDPNKNHHQVFLHKNYTLKFKRGYTVQCATSRKVAGLIPDGFIGIFHWHNPSGRTMALGSTQPLKEISTRNTSWGDKDGRCVGLTTLPPSCADCLEILEASTSWNPQGFFRPVMGLLYRFKSEKCMRYCTFGCKIALSFILFVPDFLFLFKTIIAAIVSNFIRE
jgi:hypothetical protein